jgi:hypothetical protein
MTKMKIVLGIPGIGDVSAAFAHDLARLTAHVAATRADVQLRLIASTGKAETADEAAAARQEVIDAALEWGADMTMFPDTSQRIPADVLDAVFEHVAAEQRRTSIVIASH